MPNIVEYAKIKCGFEYITAITNGTLPLNRYLGTLPYIDEICVSVDGYDKNSHFIRDEGIMETVINNINGLKKYSKVHLIYTLHKKNIDFMPKYNFLANTLGVTYNYSIFTVNPYDQTYREYVFNEEDLKQVANTLMGLECNISIQDTPINDRNLVCRKKCEAGNKVISIATNGDIYPCHMLMDPKLKLGNLLTDDKNLIGIVFSDTNPFQTLTCDNIKECAECNYRPLCGGGCRGRSYLAYKHLNKKDTYCSFIQSYYEQMIYQIKHDIVANQS